MNIPTYNFGLIQSRAYRILQEHVYAALSAYDLNPSYWSMLGIIAQAHDGIRQVEIARQMHVKAPLVTAMTKELQDRELIQSVPNQFDARAKLIALTPKGKKYMKQVETSLQKTLRKLLEGVTESDMRAYRKVLKAIISNQEAEESKSA